MLEIHAYVSRLGYVWLCDFGRIISVSIICKQLKFGGDLCQILPFYLYLKKI
jgi:hypothetical protein